MEDNRRNGPVEDWGFDALLAAVQHGSAAERQRIALAVETNPAGVVAGRLDEVLEAAAPSRRIESFRRVIFSALSRAARAGEPAPDPTARS